MDKVEKLQLILMKERELTGINISEGIICEKALQVYNDLLRKTPGTSAEGESWFIFTASRDWFHKFKQRIGIHSADWHGRQPVKSRKQLKICW